MKLCNFQCKGDLETECIRRQTDIMKTICFYLKQVNHINNNNHNNSTNKKLFPTSKVVARTELQISFFKYKHYLRERGKT